jgi:hypothetical protein
MECKKMLSITILIALSFSLGLTFGHYMFSQNREQSKSEELVAINQQWFRTATEALQWAINNVNDSMLSVWQEQGWIMGWNITDYDICIKPDVWSGYNVQVLFYGTRLSA